jgi:hypothetical protein
MIECVSSRCLAVNVELMCLFIMLDRRESTVRY